MPSNNNDIEKRLWSAADELRANSKIRAKLRVMVKRILRKYGYPPDKQEKVTQTVLEQAEMIAADWAEA